MAKTAKPKSGTPRLAMTMMNDFTSGGAKNEEPVSINNKTKEAAEISETKSTTEDKVTAPKETTRESLKKAESTGSVKPAGKVGRPRKEPMRNFTISVPERLMVDADMGALLRGKGSMSAYITALVSEDIKKNGEAYRLAYESFSSVKLS